METYFPKDNQPHSALDPQARDMLQVLAITGFQRETAMRLCLRMRIMMRDMSDEEFRAQAMGAKLKPVDPSFEASKGSEVG